MEQGTSGREKMVARDDGTVDSIGAATMKTDGTIVSQLRAEGKQGMIGDALVEYPPSHPQYVSVLKHLGGLLLGESKPVPPWSDKSEGRR